MIASPWGLPPALFAVALAAAVGPALAAAEAQTDARLLEAIDWYTGVAGRVDDVRSRALLEEVVATTGSPLSTMWVARCHSRGRMGYQRDEALAGLLAAGVIADIRAAAAAGDPEATFLMGTAYDEGLGEAEDPSQAAVWYRRAADAGHVLASHNLGNVYAAGRGVAQDDAEAVRWWIAAAERGDAIALLRLGEFTEAGRGGARDLAAATAWYRRSAERGNAQARAALERLGG